MPDLVLGSAAIEQARTVVASEARRVPAHADLVTPLPAPALGGLDAGALLGALRDLVTAMEDDLAAGGRRLDEADRALDATMRSAGSADTSAAVGFGRG